MRKKFFKILHFKRIGKRITAFLFSLAITLTVISFNPALNVSAISCRKDGFNKSAYSGKLNGNLAHDVAIIANSALHPPARMINPSGNTRV